MLSSLNLRLRQGSKLAQVKNKVVSAVGIYKIHCQNMSVDYMSRNQVLKDKLCSMKTSYTEGFTCYHLQNCTLCSKDRNSLSSNVSIYVNKKTGHFLCLNCKISGDWMTLHDVLDSCKKKSASVKSTFIIDSCNSYDISFEWKEIRSTCCSLHLFSNDEFEAVWRSFNLTNVTKKQCELLDIYINVERNLLFFPIYLSGSIVGYRTFNINGHCSTFPKKDCPGLLSYPGSGKSSSAVLVADLKDFIALTSQELSTEIVCLPYGVKTLPQTLLPCLEKFEKIILWLGLEGGAWQSSIQFAKKLNEKRCYLIRPTESQATASQVVSDGRKVKDIISNAKPVWHQFITTFSSLREDVHAEIQNISIISGVTWTRFPQLNKILKGHRRGELTILTGPTGSGKTTFISEYSLDLAMQGVNTLWGSFEIKNSRLACTMLQQFSGVSLTDHVELFDTWADKFEMLPIYFLTFHGQNSLKAVMNAVEHSSYTLDIAHVIIDNVQFMINTGADSKSIDRFWIQDSIIQAFRKFATVNNCHVTLVMHPRKEIEGTDLSMNSIFGSAKASQEADNILIIQDRQSSSSKNKKFLQICKNRFTGDLGTLPLQFDKKTLTFSKKTDSSSNNNKEETNAETYETDSINDNMENLYQQNITNISF